jgi:hypothetical protein
LQATLAHVLPDYLAPHVFSGPIKNGALPLFTTHNALAARLRHLEPGLREKLQQHGWIIDTIKIRIRPELATTHTAPPKIARLSNVGITCLKTLHQQLSASPLQTTVLRMIERHEEKKE